MNYTLEHIANKLKEARKAAHLSQRQLAAKVGLTQAHISRIEQGEVDLKTSNLIELMRALDLELELVPRQLVPAVQALNPPAERSLHRPQNDVYWLVNTLAGAMKTNSSPELKKMYSEALEFRRIPISADHARGIRSVVADVKQAMQKEDTARLVSAARNLQQIRNMIMHGASDEAPSQVPAYRLGENDDG